MKKTGSILVGLIAVFVLVFAVCTPSYAYFGAKVGAFLPNDDDDGLDGFDTGYSIEAFYGYEFSPNFALEAGVGYFRSERSDSYYDIDGPVDDDITVSAIPLTLTAKGTYALQQGFSLFAGAGVGAYFTKVEEDLSQGYISVSDDDTPTAFGFHVVAGAEYKFANGMAALAEFKWFTVEPEFELFKDFYEDYPGDIEIGGMVLSLGVKF